MGRIGKGIVNNRIADRAPADYWPEFRDEMVADRKSEILFQHALHPDWHDLDYESFLEKRRRGIAAVIRRGFDTLLDEAGAESMPEIREAEAKTPDHIDLRKALLEAVPLEVRSYVEELLEESFSTRDELSSRMDGYLEELEGLREVHEVLDMDASRDRSMGRIGKGIVNNRIADRAPADYWPEFRDEMVADRKSEILFQHALHPDWHDLDYESFLEKRRRGIAAVIRRGFDTLLDEAGAESMPEIREAEAKTPDHIDLREALLEAVPLEVRSYVEELLEESLSTRDELSSRMDGYLEELEGLREVHEVLDMDTASRVAERCESLLDQYGDDEASAHRLLAQTAVLYFVLDEDADRDVSSAIGFEDDLQVVEAVEAVLQAS